MIWIQQALYKYLGKTAFLNYDTTKMGQIENPIVIQKGKMTVKMGKY